MNNNDDSDLVNQVGKTALHYATEFKSWEVATLLLQHCSCDVSMKDAEGMTPLLYASPHLYERKQAMVVETAHPYSSNMDEFWDVSFPGATSVTIVFDSQCATEERCDYLQFYTDRSKSQRLGQEKYSGSKGGSNWPGVDGTPPLVIAAASFVAYFHSDGSREDWGFKFTATPSYPMLLDVVTAIVKHPSCGDVNFQDKVCNNNNNNNNNNNTMMMIIIILQ